MEKLLYEEFGDELIKKDEEIEHMAQKLASKDAQLASKDLEISKLKRRN